MPGTKQTGQSPVLDAIRKKFGEESIFRFGEAGTLDVSAIPTGALPLDMALGIGGLPRGRIVEVYGPESSGKTTEEVGVIVVDSVAALVPKAEIDGDMGDSHMGLHARLMSQAMRKLTGSVAQANTCLIFINQTRSKIGVVWGSPTTTTGGNALKFYASVRLDIRRIKTIKDGESSVGNRTRVKVVKNKMAPPFGEAEFDIMYGKGVDREGCILDLAVDRKLVKKSGAWFSYKDDTIGQGRPATKAYLAENPNVANELEMEILGNE